MKKNFLKKVCVAAMAVVMTVGSTMSAMAADEMTYNAGFSYSNSAWSTSVWGDTTTTKTTFTGEGTYTFTWTPGTTVDDCIMILVDIGEDGGDAATVLENYELTELTVKLDGEALDIDMSKVQTGNLEGKGRYRIEVYNEYGGTKNDSPIDINAVKDFETLEITFTLDDPATQPESSQPESSESESSSEAGGSGSGSGSNSGSGSGSGESGTPSTGDSSMVAAFVALAAVSALVVLKKRTVNE